MKKLSVLISVLLAFCLLVTAALPVFADDESAESGVEEISGEESTDQSAEESGESSEEMSEEISEEQSQEVSEEISEEVSAVTEYIHSVELTVTEPKPGASPEPAESATAGVTIKSSAWDPAYAEFSNGETYTLRVEVRSEIPFAEDCSFTFNGKAANIESVEETLAVLSLSYELSERVKLTVKDPKDGSFSVDKGYLAANYKNGVTVYEYEFGASAVIHFAPDTGFYLEYIDINGKSVEPTGNSFTFTLTEDTSVEILYMSVPRCAIDISTSLSAGINDSFVFKQDGAVVDKARGKIGTEIILEVECTEDQIYLISDASFTPRGGATRSCTVEDNRFITIPSAADGQLIVSFDYPPNAVIIIQAEHGTITASNRLPAENEPVLLTFTPDEGYELDAAVINNNPIKLNGNTYQALATGSLRVTAQFKPIPVDVNVSLVVVPGEDGIAHGEAFIVGYSELPAVVKQGTFIGVNITPDEGYKIASLTLNGNGITPSEDGQTRMLINAECEIRVTFERIQHRITAVVTKNGGGSITADISEIVRNVVYVPDGDSVTFTFTPDMNYRVYSVKVDSVEMYKEGDGNTYTFTSVKGNHTIAVTFANEDNVVTKHTITAHAYENGFISPSGELEVIQGETVVYTVTPADGYEVNYVKVDGIDVQLVEGTYTFSSVADDHTISAYFKKTYVADDEIINIPDINWGSNPIQIDIGSKTKVSKDVFAELAKYSGRTVVFNGADSTVTFTAGNIAVPDTDPDLTVRRDAACADYQQICAVIGSGEEFKNRSFAVVEVNGAYPSGAELSLSLGVRFSNAEVSYYGYDSGALVRISETVRCGANGSVNVTLKEQKTLVFISREIDSVPTFDVTVIAAKNGTVSPDKTQNVEYGMELTYEITPDKGYRIKSITVNGQPAEAAEGKLTITVTGNTTIDVKFELEEEAGSKTGLIISIVIIAIAVVGGAVLLVIKLKQNRY